MPTQVYRTQDGKRVPGTTTIIGKRKEADGLLHWAWTCGVDGIDYRVARDAAANAGTIAHAMVECDIKGQPFDRTPWTADLLERADSAFEAYQQWRKQSRLEPIASELALVSEVHRFGGTIDLVFRDSGGRVMMADLKTSNALYYDHLVQVAAYSLLWDEHNPFDPITEFHILRFAKEHADFAHHRFSQLDNAKRMFLLMREQYDLIGELKKRAA